MRTFIVFVSAAALSAVAIAGEVYKWTDKDGRVHYGDKPKTAPAEQVNRRPGQLPEAPVDPEAEKQAAARQAACEGKRKQLASYRTAAVINETDSLGNTRELSDADKQKLIAITEGQVAEACGPPPPPAPPSQAQAEAPVEPASE